MRCCGLILLALSVTSLWGQNASHKLNKADIDKMMTELSNWGRWGKQDEAGTANLITPAKRKAAAALVKDGVAVSLSRPLDTKPSLDNGAPFVIKPIKDGPFNMDEFTIAYHGFAHTHMDSLSHIMDAGKTYNGFPPPAADKNAEHLTVDTYANGFFTRGVLIDMAAFKGVEYMEPGQAIYAEDLDAWEKKMGIKVGPGDAVIIRTGRWVRRAAKGPWAANETIAGLHASCARWLRQRDVAVLLAEGPAEVLPSQVEGVAWPVHQLLLIAVGMPMLDNCDFEALTKAANERKRYTFLMTVAPMRAVNGTGSPMNPTAIF